MQFHLDGYRPGDPFVQEPHPALDDRPDGLPDLADVLVVGAGPAGLLLAAQLSAFPEIHTVVVDRRDGPLQVGQADGVACRSVEIFEAFGLADRLIGEGYQVNEVTFWRPDPVDPSRIVRTGRIDDVEDGISEMPHMIVNQARMLEYLRDHMRRSAARIAPFHGLELQDLHLDTTPGVEHPVAVRLRRGDGGVSALRARYVVGCDGSRSATRRSIGRTLEGDSTDRSWGVLDVLAVTDFPDIRLKSAITSEHGSLLVIPREGGHLVRIYVELDDDRDAAVPVTPETLTAVANRILHPYSIDVRHVGWWTVYEIGQRLCSRFDDVPDDDGSDRLPRVFIAGDACHTHSAKAGQGMNVSMADAWNLGWKLGTVLRGTARPELLRTYSAERQAVAQELIDFDRAFSTLFGTRPAADSDPSRFQDCFRTQGRFTAGVAVHYGPSMITAAHPHQGLAEGFPVGMRFASAPVVRVADAKPVQLGHAARADGAWRLYAFADRDDVEPGSGLDALAAYLGSEASPLLRYTPDGAEPDSVIDVRAVLQRGHRDVAVDAIPPVLQPRKGVFGLRDYEKVFSADPATDVFDVRGVDRDRGALTVVRPDQYVAHVLPLGAHDELHEFLAGVLVEVGQVTGRGPTIDA